VEVPTAVDPTVRVTYQPILDVARGVTAGYQARAHVEGPLELDVHAPSGLDQDIDGVLTASAIAIVLAAAPTLPGNTFVSLPIRARLAASAPVRAALRAPDGLSGVVLDIVEYPGAPADDLEHTLADYRAAGALIAVGGHGAPQPELSSIVALKPAIIRLGRDWVRDADSSAAKRSAIEIIGQLASQLDAWILAEGVSSLAELQALASLAVPLAQGPFIGEALPSWPEIDLSVRTSLPTAPAATADSDGVLRALLQPAYTATDAAGAAAVLPETTGFDVLVVIDEHRRPTSIHVQDGSAGWNAFEVLAVNVDTPVADVVTRAMARPRANRFTPLACTDNAGRFVGILRMEQLMVHLASTSSSASDQSADVQS
jgi:EAL domain-containing protein (putative c-di-GMP-specific phosphodiesterase class I)